MTTTKSRTKTATRTTTASRTATQMTPATAKRNAELRSMLVDRRREMQDDVQSRLRDGRNDRTTDGGDQLEHSDADSQGEIELTLLRMRSEMLLRLDEALARLDAGRYGSCFECEDDIAERRLRALPFAVRCHACEQKREEARGHAQQRADRLGSLSLFPEAHSS
jgi:DnaK suppressor protein